MAQTSTEWNNEPRKFTRVTGWRCEGCGDVILEYRRRRPSKCWCGVDLFTPTEVQVPSMTKADGGR